jgi:hypothetical protein
MRAVCENYVRVKNVYPEISRLCYRKYNVRATKNCLTCRILAVRALFRRIFQLHSLQLADEAVSGMDSRNICSIFMKLCTDVGAPEVHSEIILSS